MVLEMPHALNPSIYRLSPCVDKDVKIGFVGARYPSWIGDCERNSFLERCSASLHEKDKIIEIGGRNVTREQWAALLKRCMGTIGAEAGTYYLDRKGLIMKNAKEYVLRGNGNVEGAFDIGPLLGTLEYVSGKAISSRHFEPIGTKTVQILLEGEYNGILKPNVHYLEVKKDLSNFSDKIVEFSDPTRRDEIAQCAYEFVMEHHTYSHRIKNFVTAVSN
jgi:spore maturation protein CgeB